MLAAYLVDPNNGQTCLLTFQPYPDFLEVADATGMSVVAHIVGADDPRAHRLLYQQAQVHLAKAGYEVEMTQQGLVASHRALPIVADAMAQFAPPRVVGDHATAYNDGVELYRRDPEPLVIATQQQYLDERDLYLYQEAAKYALRYSNFYELALTNWEGYYATSFAENGGPYAPKSVQEL